MIPVHIRISSLSFAAPATTAYFTVNDGDKWIWLVSVILSLDACVQWIDDDKTSFYGNDDSIGDQLRF